MPPTSEFVQPALTIALVLAVVLVAPFLAERARLPGFVGIAAAGLVLGPHALALIPQDMTISFLGRLGLLYVFFAAGAEMDFDRIVREPRSATASSSLAFFLPFLAALGLGLGVLELGLLPSLLLGCVFAASPLACDPIAQRLGLSRQRAVVASVASSAIANSLALAVLAVLARATRGLEGPAAAFRLAILVALWAAASVLVIPWIATRFFKKVKSDGSIEFAFVLATGFACAFAAEAAGLEPLIGAFLGGLLLNRFIPESSALMKRLAFVGDTLFVPFFLIYVGGLCDPAALYGSLGGLAQALLIIAASVAAKWLASALARLFLGYTPHESGMLFGLSMNHAAFTLAIAFVGWDLGLFNAATLDSVLLLVAASCFMARKLGRRAAKQLAAVKGEAETARLRPPTRVLIALSNPSSIRSLVDLSILLRERGSEAPLFPVAIVAQAESSHEELVGAENLLAQAVVEGVAAAVPVFPSTRVSMNAADGLLQAAADNRAGVIVMGWNRAPRLSHSLYGSTIEQVILGSEALVIVARMVAALGAIDRSILVLPPLTERHPGFQRSIAILATFLRNTGSRLRVLTTRPNGPAARAALGDLRAHGQVKFAELESWKELGAAVRDQGHGRIALFLFCVRPGEPAWHPALEKLPQRLAEDLAEVPLFLCYLPERPEPAGAGVELVALDPAAATGSGIFERSALAGRVRPALASSAITDAIRELLRPAFEGDRKVLSRLTGLFTDIAQKQPIELKPGIVLLHAHVHEVGEALVFFGARPEGFRILALDRPAKIIVLLCAPAEQGPEEHLRALGEIARLFKDGRVAGLLGIADEDLGTKTPD